MLLNEFLDEQFLDSVLLVKFDDLVVDPVGIMEEIACFTGTIQTRSTKRIIKRENLPRKLTDKTHLEMEITKHLRPEILEVFQRTMALYEEFCSYAGGSTA